MRDSPRVELEAQFGPQRAHRQKLKLIDSTKKTNKSGFEPSVEHIFIHLLIWMVIKNIWKKKITGTYASIMKFQFNNC